MMILLVMFLELFLRDFQIKKCPKTDAKILSLCTLCLCGSFLGIIYFWEVSNGKIWQFGKLGGDVFTRNKNLYMIQDLDKLFAAVNYIFQQCE